MAQAAKPQTASDASVAVATPSITLRVPENDAQRFDVALQALAQKEKVAIVAEGVPLYPFPVKEPPALIVRLTEPEQDVAPDESNGIERSTVLSRVARVSRSYDYEVTRIGPVFALRKRYTDPNDLPDVSPEEAIAFLRRAVALMAALNPDTVTDSNLPDATVKLVGGLNDSQMALLHQGKLTLADLNPDQQEQAKNFTLYFHLWIPYNDLRNVLAMLQKCANPHNYLKWDARYEKNKKTLGIVDPKGWFGGPDFTPLTNDDFNTVPQSESVVQERNYALLHPALLRGVMDLRSVADSWKQSGSTSVVVADAIAQKRACVYGAEFAPHEEIMRAAAAIYGLRLVAHKDGSHTLAEPAVPAVLNVGDLKDAFVAILPDSYRRALHMADREARIGVLDQRRNGPPPDFLKYIHQGQALDAHPQNMRLEGIRRLVYDFGKHAGKPWADTTVPALTTDEKNDITAILMNQALFQFRMLTTSKQPAYLSDWNALSLGGTIDTDKKGKKAYHLFLCIPNPHQPGSMIFTNGLAAESRTE